MGNGLLAGQASWREEELRLLTLVAEGCSNKEIAYRLCVSPTTVKKRLTRLRRVLDAQNRIMLVRRALAYGLVRDEP